MLFAALTWHKLIDPWTPMKTGTLAHDAVSYHTEDNTTGVIRYSAPYAVPVYYGVGRRFRTEKHPLATAKWDEAAKQAGKGEELAKAVQAFIRRG